MWGRGVEETALKNRSRIVESGCMLRHKEPVRPKAIPWRLFALELCVVVALVCVLMVVGRV